MIPNVLSIAGTDPSGGAGIQADLKTFGALGAYGMSVITAVVAQNTQGVRNFVTLEPSFVAQQLAAVFDDVRVDAVKIGMVATAPIAHAIADVLEQYPRSPVVIDPVMVAKSGDHLVDEAAVEAIRTRLIPLATGITPNLPEAAVLTGQPRQAGTLDQMREILPALRDLGAQWVLLKGGHLAGPHSVDVLDRYGQVTEFTAERVPTTNTHGTGCTLSAAIAALLPTHGTVDSVQLAKDYLTGALVQAGQLDVGSGHGPVHHFHIYQESSWPLSTR